MKENYTVSSNDYAKLDSLEFDILKIKNNHEKYKLIWAMFNYLDYFNQYHIEVKIFNEFILKIDEKYSVNNNPFHNFDHAFTGKRSFLKEEFILLFNHFFIYLEIVCLIF